MIQFVEINKGSKVSVYYKTNNDSISLGDLICLEDGFFNWFPPNYDGSCVDYYTLKTITDKLFELNKDWEKQLNNYFENEKRK